MTLIVLLFIIGLIAVNSFNEHHESYVRDAKLRRKYAEVQAKKTETERRGHPFRCKYLEDK